MRHGYTALLVVVCAASWANAHFIWIVPEAGGGKAKVIFSDSLQPDSPELLAKIAHTKVSVHKDGQNSALSWNKGTDAFLLSVGKGPQTLLATCNYGVIQRGSAEPFLLVYTAKACLGVSAAKGDYAKLRPTDAGGLEIVPVENSAPPEFVVFWKGKPLADAEVVFLPPDGKSEQSKSDNRGIVALKGAKPGQYGLRARHVEAKEGEHDGKKYKEARHYATLVTNLADSKPAGGAKADPAATKLLAEARAARAQWQDFPGFTADIEVNLDGHISRGLLHVDAGGKVTLEKIDKSAEGWARRTLGSAVAHRIDNSASRNTPCAFADDDVNHPLGRLINVLNDELHSSYRIRDRQIMVVNRQMDSGKFTITMQENRTNAEGKYLPISYMVSYWDSKTGQLQRGEGHYQSWTRVGKYDLPATIRVITAAPEGGADKSPALSAKSLTLSNPKLLAK